VNFTGGVGWLRESGVDIVDLQSDECVRMLGAYIRSHPDVWAEDIGE
jgi:cytosine deaminase